MDRRAEQFLNLGFDGDGRSIIVPPSALDTHVQILAPTGYGKSRLIARIAQELVSTTSEAAIVIDPAGDLANHLRRWAYECGHGDRLVVIDPRERRMVCGLNPVRPWTDDHLLQAGVLRDVIRHALGSNETSANAPLAGQWIGNVLCALLECGLTLHEIVPLLDFTDPTFRNAVVSRLRPSVVKTDFAMLDAILSSGNSVQAMKLLNEQLGSTVRRLRQFVTNGHLMPMLAGQEHAVDWRWMIDNGKLVVVNLGLEGNALTDEDQRLVGQLVVSSIIRTCFSRPEAERRPVTLLIDEAGKLASPEMATALNEGRKFKLRLVLAHQTLSQLIRQPDNDRSLLDAVVNNTRLKFVFGGLGPRDAAEVGQTLFGHFGDPDKRKLELRVPMQLSHVVDSVTKTLSIAQSRGRSYGIARTESWAESDTWGTGHQVGAGSVQTAGESHGLGVSHAHELAAPLDGFYTESTALSAVTGRTESVVDNSNEQHGFASSESMTIAHGRSLAIGRSQNVTRGQMVVPGEPFEITTSVQFESLDEQLHRFVSAMIRQPDRHAVLAWGKSMPTLMRVADVPEPRVSLRQAEALDLRYMRRLPCFAEPEQIEREIVQRREVLIGQSSVEVVDTRVAIERRRATRRAATRAGDQPGGDVAGLPARIPVRPIRPRGGRAAAKLPMVAEGM